MKRPIIYPYKIGSKSAQSLKESLKDLGCKTVYPDRKYKYKEDDIIINWGNKTEPKWVTPASYMTGFNTWGIIPLNKIDFYDTVSQDEAINILDWTVDIEVANAWLVYGHTVVVRHLTNSHSGKGIELVYPGDTQLPAAPLYVKYKKKEHEYRVHIWGGEVIDIQQKRKKKDINNDDVNYQVRCYQNGWVYCREGIGFDQMVTDQALLAMDASGLDFGAVDVIWNSMEHQAYVLEINTAPGLEGTTLEIYSNKIRELCQ